MTVKLLTKQHLKFLSLKGGCIGLFGSTLVKIHYCWKYHVTAPLRKVDFEKNQQTTKKREKSIKPAISFFQSFYYQHTGGRETRPYSNLLYD